MPRSRIRLTSLAVALTGALLAAQAAVAAPPAVSGPVSRFTDFFAVAYFDEADELIALGGPPPEEGCFGLGFDHEADVTLVETGAGPVKSTFHQDNLPVLVYDMSAGHPCDTLMAGGTPVPLYVGTITSVANDNDTGAPTLTRTNSFGTSSVGWVEDAGGATCRFSAHVRLHITREGAFEVISEGITIAC